MKKAITLFILLLLISCDEVKFEYVKPANPPVGIQLQKQDNGDYGLLFRSENEENLRFKGFLIFINPTREELLLMSSYEEAEYIIEDNDDDDNDIFNQGIDTPIAILFSNDINYESKIIITNVEYTVTTKLSIDKIIASTDSWLTLRTFLYDESNKTYITSSPGNSVYIEP
ncbi:MAG: hypothetical protein SVR08_12555 [Spirochaetota bacterium]|nr:hypothetical protein [Spirochaetota bacterium]